MRGVWLVVAGIVLLLAVAAGGIAWFAWFKHDAMRRDFGGMPEIEALE